MQLMPVCSNIATQCELHRKEYSNKLKDCMNINKKDIVLIQYPFYYD